MPSVPEKLRQAREAQGLDIYQMAEITKIKTDHLRALETGQFEMFIAPVYIRGFARTYARALKLDVPVLLAELDAELSRHEKFHEHPPLTNQPRGLLDLIMLRLSRLNWRVVGVVALALVVMGIIFANVRARQRATEDPLKDFPPALRQSPPEQRGEKLPLPTPPARRP